jgi:hypothetical protein
MDSWNIKKKRTQKCILVITSLIKRIVYLGEPHYEKSQGENQIIEVSQEARTIILNMVFIDYQIIGGEQQNASGG